MSVNGAASCGTCHRQELAFTDGRGRAMGATGELHARGAMSLVNVAWNRRNFLARGDPPFIHFEEQALKPMMSVDPVELGFSMIERRFLEMARSDPPVPRIVPRSIPKGSGRRGQPPTLREPWLVLKGPSFPGDLPGTGFTSKVTKRQIQNPPNAVVEVLFFLDGGPSCFRCHGGFNFSDSTAFDGGNASPAPFHNTGLYNLAGEFSYPPGGRGLYEFSKRAEDVGRFKAPTLRNIALTAPYMHDGAIANLSDVLAHYATGGRTIAAGPFARSRTQ